MDRKKSIRNIVIFSAVAVGGGFVGAALDKANPPADSMQGLGVLLWLVSPLAANLLLRAFGGDGWADFGLKPNLKKGWGWYLVSLLIVPVVVTVTLVVAAAFGAVSLDGFAEKGIAAFLPVLLVAFAGSMVKNIFEEFSWRGYLTPRFKALGLHPFLNAFLTAVVWVSWHIPYYYFFLPRDILQMHTPLSIPALIGVAFLVMPFHALAYQELRFLSGTVWTVWLLHNMANAASMPMISEGFVTLKSGYISVFLTPGTEGVFYSLLMGVIGLLLYRWRKRKLA